MVMNLKNKKGQTSVEWLMLMAAATTTALIVISNPIANYTTTLIDSIKKYTQNIVLRGESEEKAPSPSDSKRFRPVHL